MGSAGVGARPNSGDRPTFDAGSLCLNFAAALRDVRPGTHDPDVDDRAATGSRLVGWLRLNGLPEPVGGLTERDLDDACALWAVVDTVARCLVATTPPDANDIGRLNASAQHATPVVLLRPGGRHKVVLEEVDAAASLSVVARDAIDLFSGPHIGRLHVCAGLDCELLFLDRSPSGRRRWCSMKRCGERVASASYRQRRMTAATAS